MKNRHWYGHITPCLVFVIFSVLTLLPSQALAQQPNSAMSQESAPPTPVAELIAEAEKNNLEISTVYHGWQAATHVPKQASAFPETQSVQQFSVGIPRPFRAGTAAYQANRQDFQTLSGNFLDVLDLDLECRQQLAEHESAIARLQRLTGVTQ